jgi:hypothetical protein
MRKRLDWVPMGVDGSPGMIPSGKAPVFEKDFQAAWFWKLFWASLESEKQGYLRVTSQLGMLAGAHSKAFWDAEKSVVLACFEVRELEGQRWLYFPPLIEVIEDQMKKICRPHRAREEFSSETTSYPQGARPASPSQSAFDFEPPRARSASDRGAVEGVVSNEQPDRIASPATGKRAQRVQRDRSVLRESLRRYGGADA